MIFAKILSSVNLLKTIYVNFKTLPFKKALKLPILVGYRVKFYGFRRGSIRLVGEGKTGSIRLGVQSEWPIFPNQREWSMLRCSSDSVLTFDLTNSGTIVIYPGFSIVNNGTIQIGSHSLINQHCNFYCAKSIVLGDRCRIGWNTQIMDSDIHLVFDISKRVIYNPIAPVSIGDNVWVSSNCCIMKGAVIPPFSVVAGHSLVNKDFGDVTTVGNFFAGSPAKIVKTGLVRLLDAELEHKMKSHFLNREEKSYAVDETFDFYEHCKSYL